MYLFFILQMKIECQKYEIVITWESQNEQVTFRINYFTTQPMKNELVFYIYLFLHRWLSKYIISSSLTL